MSAVYDVLTGQIVSKLNDHKACVRDVSWHPYECNIISTSVSTAYSVHCCTLFDGGVNFFIVMLLYFWICSWHHSSTEGSLLIDHPKVHSICCLLKGVVSWGGTFTIVDHSIWLENTGLEWEWCVIELLYIWDHSQIMQGNYEISHFRGEKILV